MSKDPVLTLPAYRADLFRVVDGANLGDPLGIAEDLHPDDVYHLTTPAAPTGLSIRLLPQGSFEVAPRSLSGTPGHRLHLDCCARFMAADGLNAECLILAEVDAEGMLVGAHMLPLETIVPKCDYRLIGVSRSEAARKFAEIGTVSFTRGTHITLASGAQCKIEDLAPGDRILTRDAGVQEIRWIGQSTQKATGAFAPIRIQAGALNNVHDLLVSPDHRLFIYQREDTLGAGRSEVLVRAKHLLNGTTVTQEQGGYVEYFQLLFDEHQIIYAEGIAAETLLVDEQTRGALPEEIASKQLPTQAGRDTGLRTEYEVSEQLACRPDAAELLRRASMR